MARRVIPADGRSRAYIDGALATATLLGERIGDLVDLYGQHSQQSLLHPATQRAALDRFAKIDPGPLRVARADVAAIDAALADLGGDATERARQIDLLRYQLAEVVDAQVRDPDEDTALQAQEARLANAFDDELAAGQARDLLGSDGPAVDALGRAISILEDAELFGEITVRLRGLQEELSDVGSDLRAIREQIVDDPEARQAVRERLQTLVELRRKYGPTLTHVMEYGQGLQEQLNQLESHEDQVQQLTDRRQLAERHRAEVSEMVLKQRCNAAIPLSEAVEIELAKLAMPQANVRVDVEGSAGDHVAMMLAPNPGLPMLPVGKNASGGELSRTMLALRLVLAGGPPIKVFDEVDAGIGGRSPLLSRSWRPGIRGDTPCAGRVVRG